MESILSLLRETNCTSIQPDFKNVEQKVSIPGTQEAKGTQKQKQFQGCISTRATKTKPDDCLVMTKQGIPEVFNNTNSLVHRTNVSISQYQSQTELCILYGVYGSARRIQKAVDSFLHNTMQLNKTALEFEVVATQCRARYSIMKLPHYASETPAFMPVGTRGTVKGLTSRQLQDLDCHIILGNTYHLQSHPGSQTIQSLGGLHKFVDWPRGMLTDSGGFQMVSLLKLAEIQEEGVAFRSPVDGRRLMLTPEESIRIQNALGADIAMALDDVVPATDSHPARFEEATHRTTRWLDRCIAAHERQHDQNLFAIVQGGVDLRLREISLTDLVARDCPGYAIGGLAGGEDKNEFWKVVAYCTERLPVHKPRYVMGIGYPLDIVVCSALGADMYDSVYPTRTARFGVGLTSTGIVRLKNASYASDTGPLDAACSCVVCRDYTRAALHRLVMDNTTIASRLVTFHNVAYMMSLMKNMREAISEQQFPEFVKEFLRGQYPNKDVPEWALDALEASGIPLSEFR